jgi:hypothetical protein
MGRTKLGLIVPFLFVAACGGGGGGDSGPVDQETAAEYCQQSCDREAECDATTDVTMCVSDCVDDVTDLIREDVFIAVVECETALSCDATENNCFIDNCSPTSTHTAYESHCRERLAECDFPSTTLDSVCETTPSDGGGVEGGDLGFICAVNTSIISELDACFDEPDCTGVMSCFDEVTSAHGL